MDIELSKTIDDLFRLLLVACYSLLPVGIEHLKVQLQLPASFPFFLFPFSSFIPFHPLLLHRRPSPEPRLRILIRSSRHHAISLTPNSTWKNISILSIHPSSQPTSQPANPSRASSLGHSVTSITSSRTCRHPCTDVYVHVVCMIAYDMHVCVMHVRKRPECVCECE